MSGQLEECPTTGTPHFQFIVCCKKKQRFKFFKDWNKSINVRSCLNLAACKNYVNKEKTRVEGPWHFGEMKMKGGDHKSIDPAILLKNKDEIKTMLLEGDISFY